MGDSREDGMTQGEFIQTLLTNILLPILLSIVSALVSIVLLKLKKKYNLDIDAATEKKINDAAENAIHMVEEKAASKIMDTCTKSLSNDDKLNMAIAKLVQKVPAITREKADAYVHAALARMSGVGATGDKVIK